MEQGATESGDMYLRAIDRRAKGRIHHGFDCAWSARWRNRRDCVRCASRRMDIVSSFMFFPNCLPISKWFCFPVSTLFLFSFILRSHIPATSPVAASLPSRVATAVVLLHRPLNWFIFICFSGFDLFLFSGKNENIVLPYAPVLAASRRCVHAWLRLRVRTTHN